jgi:hypothetical protein
LQKVGGDEHVLFPDKVNNIDKVCYTWQCLKKYVI